MKHLTTPLDERKLSGLEAGDVIELTGRVVTARDRAYARAIELLRERKRLPIELEGEAIYHCGPLIKKTARGWRVISAGPTTSGRLDAMQIEFLGGTGVRALIGKGGIGEGVAAELPRLGCVYMAFTGGAGVLAANSVVRVEGVRWLDLGQAEAMWVLRVKGFGPLIVGVDLKGRNLYARAEKLKGF